MKYQGDLRFKISVKQKRYQHFENEALKFVFLALFEDQKLTLIKFVFDILCFLCLCFLMGHVQYTVYQYSNMASGL